MGRYDDMINLPRPSSPHRPHMSNHDRAAQFAPFAALTGYEEVLEETARTTQSQVLLDEDQAALVDRRLRQLARNLPVPVTVTYFQPDHRKAGGQYLTITGRAVAIRQTARVLLLDNGTQIPLDSIVQLGGAGCEQTWMG